MKKDTSVTKILFNIVFPIIIILLAISAIVGPTIIAMQGSNCVQSTIINNNGNKVVGYEMENIKDIGYFEYVNHFPNQYIKTDTVGENPLIEDVNHLTIAPFGTIQFVIFNYDPEGEHFREYMNGTDFYSPATNSNLLSLFIPFAYDSATIWTNGEYYTTNGRMNNYNPEDYNSTKYPVINDMQRKEDTKLVVKMTDKIDEIKGNRIDDAYIVTIHYQSKRGVNYKNNVPTFGNPKLVTRAYTLKYTTALTSVMLMVALVLSCFAIMLLKLSLHKLPYLGIVFGALIIDIAQFVSLKYSTISGKFLVMIAIAIISIFTLLSCKPKTYNKPWYISWLVSIIISSINAIIVFIISLFGSYSFVVLYSRITFSIMIILQYVFAIFNIKRMTIMEFSGIAIALTVPILAMFTNYSLIWYINPTCLVINISALVLIWNILDTMLSLENKNKKLTDNLMAEVAAQTHNLHSAIQDREILLSFLSHDLRKSSIMIDSLANQIIADKDRVNSPIAQRIKDKNEVIINSLGDISKYMKQNFSSEPFEIVKVNDIFTSIEKSLGPDCEAYGIKLQIVSSSHKVRCKKQGLISVLNNLIFNAVEHAECKNIILSCSSTKKGLDIYVHDDGIGIDDAANVFSPYITSEQNDNNMGLGLFIVKSEIESMGGSINYKLENGSTFIISLLREYDE